ncbi:MAG: RDD family protein [Candidatus Sedimenticola sp. PURPLELP]
MNTAEPQNTSSLAPPSLLRRLGAVLYDTLLVAGLLLMASTIITLPTEMMFGAETSARVSKALLVWLWPLIPLLFFTWFWTRGGQTLGMRSWRIRVVTEEGAPLEARQALLRAACAVVSWLPLGLGFLWVLFDSEKRAWHDMLSGTRLIRLPKS